MPEAVIVDAVRSPIGNLGGGLASVRPDDLAAMVIKTIVERNAIPRIEAIIARYPKIGFLELVARISEAIPIAGRITI